MVLYPGHGDAILSCANEKIDNYLKHLNNRENRVITFYIYIKIDIGNSVQL